jgi:uncharacterized membrane protein
MIQLPPIPEWNRLHPLIVHFPIALLLVAPLFVILGGVLAPPKGRPLLGSALILMAIGTISLFLALETGDAAARIVGEGAQIREALKQHEELAETTCLVFSVLTIVFGCLLMLSRVLKRELSRSLSASLLAAFLILYGTGALFLVNTAHQGGRLVHDLGVDASCAPTNRAAVLGPQTTDQAAEH